MTAERVSSVSEEIEVDRTRLPWLGELREPVDRREPGWPIVAFGALMLAILGGGFALIWKDMVPFSQANAPTTSRSVATSSPTPGEPPIVTQTGEAPPLAASDTRGGIIAAEDLPPAVRRSHDAIRAETPPSRRVASSEQMAANVQTSTAPTNEPSMKTAMVDAMAATLSNIPSPSEYQLTQPQPQRPTVNPAARVAKRQTVRMGVYLTQAQADLAWKAAVRDYTFLVTMPKQVAPVNYRGRRYYALNLGTPSRKHAEQLCRNLKSIGHSCSVG